MDSNAPVLLLYVALAGAAMYFLMIRPARNRQRQQQATVSALQPGSEIMTTAGIFGTVAAITEDQISLEIAPGVFMRILPAAVARVMDAEEPAPPAPDAEQPESEPPVD
jgi:preprotein translocase subunit YajC